MAMRQSKQPLDFNLSTRPDRAIGMSSGRGGDVVPFDFIPLLPGDSCAGRINVRLDLAEMPKPLQNAVLGKVQAWFVPKSAHPQFSGMDEFLASYHGYEIKQMGNVPRTPPPLHIQPTADNAVFWTGDIANKLGIHPLPHTAVNKDLVDAYNLVWNFRAAAHSSNIELRPFFLEDAETSVSLAPAFWPSGRMAGIVPDYERALVVGALDFDVSAGSLPVEGIGIVDQQYNTAASVDVRQTTGDETESVIGWYDDDGSVSGPTARIFVRKDYDRAGFPDVMAEMAGTTFVSSLADIDKARLTQGFAKVRAQYAGNDFTGYNNDDAIIAAMMQGLQVSEEAFKQPWLLDSDTVTFGLTERHATDAANLDDSVSKGYAEASLALNVPRQETGGVIIITVEVLPEQLHERQGDPWLGCTTKDDYPNALRDAQRVEPVDQVPNWRIDARHTNPSQLYGYEPMNSGWVRDFTRLGGDFYQATPGNVWTEARSAIWQADVVDPVFNADHFVVPDDFPHDVFSDTTADCFELVFQRAVTIRGLTQFGDVLHEANDDYTAVQSS